MEIICFILMVATFLGAVIIGHIPAYTPKALQRNYRIVIALSHLALIFAVGLLYIFLTLEA